MLTKSRSDFSQLITVDGVLERDINSCNWDQFIISRPITYYQINQGDIQRPDLLSLKIYGNMAYWWVLCKFNNIDDLWADLIPGEYLQVPSLQDIQDFYIRVKIQ